MFEQYFPQSLMAKLCSFPETTLSQNNCPLYTNFLSKIFFVLLEIRFGLQ